MLAIVAACSTACAGGVTYGELPTGASSINEAKGVSAEICADYLFNPGTLNTRLSDGYRLISD
jgi:hypothetical protein